MDITFREFLVWLQRPGIEVAVGIATSIIVEYIPQFERLERKWKAPVILALNLGIPIGAAAIAAWVGYQPWGFEKTFWPALVAGVLSFGGSQANWVRSEVLKLKMMLYAQD